MENDFTELFTAYDDIEIVRQRQTAAQNVSRNALQQFMFKSEEGKTGNGFSRIQRCRDALESIDRQGYMRSFHQRLFHDNFIRACARIFWMTEPPGAFARDHQKILELNGWDHLSQEILVSTPRRFGKTFAVSMFAAAMLYSTPSLELSIYSTCKRISQKLMRNVVKFLSLIYKDTQCQIMPVIRSNMEEVVLQGPDGLHDVRTVNSYPSKVTHTRARARKHMHCRQTTGFIENLLSVNSLHNKVGLPQGAKLAELPPLVRLAEAPNQERLGVHLQRLQRVRLPPQITPDGVAHLPHESPEHGDGNGWAQVRRATGTPPLPETLGSCWLCCSRGRTIRRRRRREGIHQSRGSLF